MHPKEYADFAERAHAVGKTPGEYLEILCEEVLDEAGYDSKPAAPAIKPLVVLERHARIVRMAARILRVPPQVLLNWQLDYVTRDKREPDHGMLREYALGVALVFPSTEEAELVRQNFERWIARQGGKAA